MIVYIDVRGLYLGLYSQLRTILCAFVRCVDIRALIAVEGVLSAAVAP